MLYFIVYLINLEKQFGKQTGIDAYLSKIDN